EITNQLADFQKVAVRQAIQIIRDYGGAFAADVVGVGKSFIGAAIVKHFEKTEQVRPLIICPAPLVEMWENYNEAYQLNARVLSMSYLRKSVKLGANWMLEEPKYRDRNFVLVDESHNFRHHTTQRYEVLQAFLSAGHKRCIFLTATPRNKTAWDIYHQIKLFHPDDKTDLPVDPQNLKDYFKAIEEGQRKLQDLLPHLLIRRTRQHILKWYGFDSETNEPINPAEFEQYVDGRKRAYILVAGRHQYFPRRELETIEYSIEATYRGLYQRIRSYLGRSKDEPREQKNNKFLKYARYGLWHYVTKDKQRESPYSELKRAGANIRGLVRILLFKRLESSVYAFAETLRRLIGIHQGFLAAMEQGIVPAGDEAQKILYESDVMEERDLFDALEKASEKYNINDFEAEQLRADIEHDIELFQEILSLVEPITEEQDNKLQTLIEKLNEPPLGLGKVLIFTQYADTARYLARYLEKKLTHRVVDFIFSCDKSKAKVVGRFAPKANPEYRFSRGETEIEVLVATDVLAEGLNLQDCDKVINYDLHWNPVRLIQRFGRIDRIGSEYETIWAYNFLPELELERNLHITEKLRRRINEIHETIGEDSAILDKSEQLNEEAMYAIYEKKGARLYQFEEEDDLVDLNEAEEFLRQLRKDNPAEFERIANLRDGIRSAKRSDTTGAFVFCQADRYHQLFLVNSAGEILSRDIPRILSIIRCSREEPTQKLPADYNRLVMKVKRKFDEEVKHRAAEKKYAISLTQGQRYVLRELRLYFQQIDDDDQKAQINLLEKVFRQPVSVAVDRELKRLRRNGVTGLALVKNLSQIYHQHGLQEQLDRTSSSSSQVLVPKIVCSEAFQV
ncbi:MAG: DEAD/DEAH box helicase, partial [candidate division KSB1 bacterium]|nr:DEAD/DEAH box helicase [candidate division KSB1 bacterium]